MWFVTIARLGLKVEIIGMHYSNRRVSGYFEFLLHDAYSAHKHDTVGACTFCVPVSVTHTPVLHRNG